MWSHSRQKAVRAKVTKAQDATNLAIFPVIRPDGLMVAKTTVQMYNLLSL
jgi:hypothetical protein